MDDTYQFHALGKSSFSQLTFELILQRPRGLKAMHDLDSDSE
jgi:hypothetical protein